MHGARMRACIGCRNPPRPPSFRLWSKTDSTFRLPRTTAHFRLSSPALYDTPASAARAHLLLKLLEDRLCETSYLAEVAGLNCNTWFEGRAGEAACTVSRAFV